MLTYVTSLTTAGEPAAAAAEQAAASLKLHGYAGAGAPATRPLISGIAESAKALADVGRAARTRGELVVPQRGV